MILGLNGIHTFNGFVLNKLDETPRARLNNIVGLRSTPEYDPVADSAISRVGEVPRWGLPDGKTLTYEGVIQAKNAYDLLSMAEEMGSSFMSDGEEKLMMVEPHPNYPSEEGLPELPTRRYWARVISCDISEEYAQSMRTPWSGYELPFTIVMRMSDPRYYYPSEDIVDEQSSGLSEIGGAGVPFTPGSWVGSPSAMAGQVVVENPGTAHVDPLIIVRGPVRNPVISHIEQGVFLRFRDLDIGPNGGFRVDFKRRTAVRFNGNQIRANLAPASTWWDRGVPGITPGENTIRLRGYSVGSEATVQVRFNPADWT